MEMKRAKIDVFQDRHWQFFFFFGNFYISSLIKHNLNGLRIISLYEEMLIPSLTWNHFFNIAVNSGTTWKQQKTTSLPSAE